MSNSSNTDISASPARPFDEEQVFQALSNVSRRRLVVALARGGPQMASDVADAGKAIRRRGRFVIAHHKMTSTAKNLKVLIDVGIVVPLPNPKDGRKPLYALAPGLNVATSDGLTVIDFGFLVVRLSPDGD